MTQNIYDNPDFFAAHGQLGRSIAGLDGAAEWPALQALLPDVSGARVLDLGFGWFSRWARAIADTRDAAIHYTRADLEEVVLPGALFELVYSSLALHYIAALHRLLTQVHAALAPGGHFVGSLEHPIYTAPSDPQWSLDATGRRVWPVEGYSIEGPRTTDWLAQGVIKLHRTIGTYVNALVDVGFRLVRLVEWAPTDAQIVARPELLDERARPMFLLLAAVRI